MLRENVATRLREGCERKAHRLRQGDGSFEALFRCRRRGLVAGSLTLHKHRAFPMLMEGRAQNQQRPPVSGRPLGRQVNAVRLVANNEFLHGYLVARSNPAEVESIAEVVNA